MHLWSPFCCTWRVHAPEQASPRASAGLRRVSYRLPGCKGCAPCSCSVLLPGVGPWCSAGAKIISSPSSSSHVLGAAAPGDLAVAPLHALQRFCCSCSLLAPAVPTLPSPSRRPAPRFEGAELLRAAARADGAGTWQKSLRLREVGGTAETWGGPGGTGQRWEQLRCPAVRSADAEQPGQVREAGAGQPEMTCSVSPATKPTGSRQPSPWLGVRICAQGCRLQLPGAGTGACERQAGMGGTGGWRDNSLGSPGPIHPDTMSAVVKGGVESPAVPPDPPLPPQPSSPACRARCGWCCGWRWKP